MANLRCFLIKSQMGGQNTGDTFRLNLENWGGATFFFHRPKNGGNTLPFGLRQLQFIKKISKTLVAPTRA